MGTTYNLNWTRDLYGYTISDTWFCVTPMSSDIKISWVVESDEGHSSSGVPTLATPSYDIWYSFDKNNWTKCDIKYWADGSSTIITTGGRPVYFKGTNDKIVSFKCNNGQSGMDSWAWISKYLSLKISDSSSYHSGKVILSGSFSSLFTGDYNTKKTLTSTITQTWIPSNYYVRSTLFAGVYNPSYSYISYTIWSKTIFTNCPIYDASHLMFDFNNTKAPKAAFAYLFYGSSISIPPVIAFNEYDDYSLFSTFKSCTNLYLKKSADAEYKIPYNMSSGNSTFTTSVLMTTTDMLYDSASNSITSFNPNSTYYLKRGQGDLKYYHG